jgi:hypothetical protein
MAAAPGGGARELPDRVCELAQWLDQLHQEAIGALEKRDYDALAEVSACRRLLNQHCRLLMQAQWLVEDQRAQLLSARTRSNGWPVQRRWELTYRTGLISAREAEPANESLALSTAHS